MAYGAIVQAGRAERRFQQATAIFVPFGTGRPIRPLTAYSNLLTNPAAQSII
jgi:hypothetical protein